MKKKQSIHKAMQLLKKLLNDNDNIDRAIGEMLKKNVPPMEITISIVKVLNITLDEADDILMNSAAFSHLREDTLKLRNMAHGVLMDEADEIIKKPNGKRILRFDLDNDE